MKATTFRKTIAEMVKTPDGDRESPLPISVIPNYMGINLCSVDAISWVRQDEDKQLVSLTIHFIPATRAQMRRERPRAKKRKRS